MRQLFKCPKCGYRNYITREDLDAAFDAEFGASPRRSAPRMKERFDRHVARLEWRSRHPRLAWLSVICEILMGD